MILNEISTFERIASAVAVVAVLADRIYHVRKRSKQRSERISSDTYRPYGAENMTAQVADFVQPETTLSVR